MSDTLKRTEDFHFFEESWNRKINNNLTKNQALEICNSLYLYCKDNEELLDDITELKKYIRK